MKSLLIEIARFLRRSGMSASAFGRRAVRDPRFVHDLRNGRECGTAVSERVRDFIASHDESETGCS